METGSDLARLTRSALSTSWLATKLGIGTSRVELMRRSGELFAVRKPGTQEFVFPAWQFDENGRPKPFVRRLVQAAREAGLSDARLLELIEMRSGLTGGGSLADALRQGRDEQVLAAIRALRN